MARPDHVRKQGPSREGRRRRLLPWRRRVTAVDLDGDMLRVVQSETGPRGPRVTRYAATLLEGVTESSPAAERGKAIGRGLRKLGIHTRRVVMGLPRARVMLRTLELPSAGSPGELAAMVRFQVNRDLPFPASEAVVDFTLQPSPGGDAPGSTPADAVGAGTTRVLAAVVKANLLEEFLETTRAAGLHPDAIGLRSHANARCVELCRLQPEERCLAIVSLQSNEIIFDVLYDGTLAFSRVGPVQRPPESGGEGAGSRLEHYVQDVLMEVVRGLHNYEGVEGHGSICRLLVAGSTGAEQTVAAALTRRFELAAEVLDPVSLVGLKRVDGNGATGAQAAFGLALGALDPGGLPFDFLHPRKPPEPRNTRRLKGLATAAALTFVLLGVVSWRTLLMRGRMGERSALQEQIQAANRNAVAYRQVRAQAKTVRSWEQANERWLDHVALLSALLPPSPDLYVSSIAAGSRSSLNLSVKIRSGEILNRVGATLREAGYEVRPSAITPVSDRYGYRFQAGIELEIPAAMKVDLASLAVPERPSDDVSGTVALNEGDGTGGGSIASPVGTPPPGSGGHGAGSEPTPQPPGGRPNAGPPQDSGGGEGVIIVEEVQPSPVVDPNLPEPSASEPAASGQRADRSGRRPRPGGTPPAGPDVSGLWSRLGVNLEGMSPDERRKAIEEFRAARARERGGAPRAQRGGQP
ncbi:MAG: pilus assembly protein PilM [Verrucomicrobiae bacterium]|nr:pilus assembly protein PilM [Verrucomicrobiae bacterium]